MSETELQRRLRADFPTEILASRPDLTQLLLDAVAALTTAERELAEARAEVDHRHACTNSNEPGQVGAPGVDAVIPPPVEYRTVPAATIATLTHRAEAAEAERDAYRKAKQENDARFMRERDEARSDRDEAHARGYAAGYQMGVRESSDVSIEMSKLVAERHRQRREQGRVMMWESTAVEARTGALREASNEILKLLDAEPALRCTALYGGGVSGGSRCKKRQGHASLHSWERGEQ